MALLLSSVDGRFVHESTDAAFVPTGWKVVTVFNSMLYGNGRAHCFEQNAPRPSIFRRFDRFNRARTGFRMASDRTIYTARRAPQKETGGPEGPPVE
jgi:hypothetical protein